MAMWVWCQWHTSGVASADSGESSRLKQSSVCVCYSIYIKYVFSLIHANRERGGYRSIRVFIHSTVERGKTYRNGGEDRDDLPRLPSWFGGAPQSHPISGFALFWCPAFPPSSFPLPFSLHPLINISCIEPLFYIRHHDRCSVRGRRGGEGDGMNEWMCLYSKENILAVA